MRLGMNRRVEKLEQAGIPEDAIRTIIVSFVGINDEGRRYTTGGVRMYIGKEEGQPREKLPASFFDDEDLYEKKTEPENAERKQGKDTRFKPGQSGNPAGTRPGTRHKVTMAAQELLDGEGQALTRKAIDLALEGDLTALRLCLERIIPPIRERAVKMNLPNTSTAEGVVLSNIIEKRRIALETLELEQRISALEEKQ